MMHIRLRVSCFGSKSLLLSAFFRVRTKRKVNNEQPVWEAVPLKGPQPTAPPPGPAHHALTSLILTLILDFLSIFKPSNSPALLPLCFELHAVNCGTWWGVTWGGWGGSGPPRHVWQLQDLKGTQPMVAGNISPLPHPDKLQVFYSLSQVPQKV